MRRWIVFLGFFAGLTLYAAAAADTTFVVRQDTLPSRFADTSQWIEFTSEDSVFSIRYPGDFEADGWGGIHISHSIPFEHVDPCYFGDEERDPLPELVDFDLQMAVTKGDLTRAVVMNEPGLADDYWVEDSLRLPPDFELPSYMERVSIGSLDGYRVPHGMEGCGYSAYFLSFGESQLLVVSRKFITELDPIIRDYQKHRELPGVVTPEQAEAIFQRILATFKYLE